jgi:hypothetical protein
LSNLLLYLTQLFCWLTHHPNDRGSKLHWNVKHPRRRASSFSSPRGPEISH